MYPNNPNSTRNRRCILWVPWSIIQDAVYPKPFPTKMLLLHSEILKKIKLFLTSSLLLEEDESNIEKTSSLEKILSKALIRVPASRLEVSRNSVSPNVEMSANKAMLNTIDEILIFL